MISILRYTLFILLLFAALATQAQWQQYSAQWEGRPGHMMYDASMTDTTQRQGLPYLISIGWRYAGCSEEGLPDALTHESLAAISDKLAAYMDIQSTCSLVGTLVHDCHWYDYYYLRDTIALAGFVREYFSRNESDFTPLISMRDDPSWSYYDERIYPDTYILEYMYNAQSISTIGAEDSKTMRLVHYAYFSSAEARDQYRIVVLERGFKEETSGRLRESTSEPYYYHFSRRDPLRVDYLTELTMHLREEAEQLDGTYDGWEAKE